MAKPAAETRHDGAPLLPKIRPRGGASISGAVFNVSTSMIGAGIMSIPATFKVLGVIPGFILILMVAFAVEVTVEFLLRYTNSGESASYGGLMAESFGKFGSVALQVCVMVTNLGDVLCGNQSEGTLHLGILQEWFGIQWWNSRACALLVIVLFVMLPFLLLRSIESLKHASAVSILLATFPKESPSLIYSLLFQYSPLSFGCHVNVHPVRAELIRPSDMSSAVRISLVLCVVIYVTVGFFGFLLFGDSIMSDMLVNFDQTSDSAIGTLLNDIVRLSYVIHLMMVFPVMNFSLRVNVDELIFPRKPLLATDTSRFVLITCVLLSFIYLAAIAVPDIWYFFQFMGTTTVMCLMFIFPSAIILRDVHGIATRRDKIVAVLVIILAAGTSLIAISSNVHSSISKK
ncbi:transmembrane amino acid transporter family protein [Actinidia rufa]|uniref:Transmembrane amino acid transporter family protein n=1 Tax=Actinidia rufa TaxID=165716 RepID=A0A7J0EAD9_9ERIC|nr:transmembrane amino acid transporter family protein [Actinidia rufa]